MTSKCIKIRIKDFQDYFKRINTLPDKITLKLTICFFRINALSHIIPRNLSTIAKQLFQTAFCIKPRIIQGGLNVLRRSNNTNSIVDEMETIVERSKFLH